MTKSTEKTVSKSSKTDKATGSVKTARPAASRTATATKAGAASRTAAASRTGTASRTASSAKTASSARPASRPATAGSAGAKAPLRSYQAKGAVSKTAASGVTPARSASVKNTTASKKTAGRAQSSTARASAAAVRGRAEEDEYRSASKARGSVYTKGASEESEAPQTEGRPKKRLINMTWPWVLMAAAMDVIILIILILLADVSKKNAVDQPWYTGRAAYEAVDFSVMLQSEKQNGAARSKDGARIYDLREDRRGKDLSSKGEYYELV